MNTATKLSGFALGLAAVFGAAYGVGQVAGPVAPAAETRHDGSADHGGGHDNAGQQEAPGHLPGGLLVSDRGYTLTPVTAPAGEFAFRISGPDGQEPAETRVDLLRDEPGLTGDPRWDALLAALAEHLLAQADLAPPAWVDARVLRRAWFPAELAIHRADALAWAPAAFRKRGVYLSVHDLAAA
ncbi:hypothetical protein [Micromonospora thermarum]|uniref:hypothetical protein n=1 Tax=Micromonospora thermarum TaxID=2720024 RepID=UPI00197B5B13|nr:hypothetical protein [Micromonospora thermarum]